jgi:3-phosphoshikimate 1-carboxyvinyltransferase
MRDNSVNDFNGITFEGEGKSGKVTVLPVSRFGCARVPSSKSAAHRMLICAALSGARSELVLDGCSEDATATARCLGAMGAKIEKYAEEGREVLSVTPVDFDALPEKAVMDAGESGSTYRFLLPVICALGLNAEIQLRGRLSERPMKPLFDALTEGGASISACGTMVSVSCRIRPGTYRLPGNISSQFISGMLFALPLLDGDSRLVIEGDTESRHYIEMTENVIDGAGIIFFREPDGYMIPGNQKYAFSGRKTVEADWSGAAFLLAAGALSRKGIAVKGLELNSIQGDRKILELLRSFGARIEYGTDESGRESVRVFKKELKAIDVDAKEIPDLVPVISAVAALAEGTTRIYNASRLRLKESDRIESTAAMIRSLGGCAEITEDGLLVHGRQELSGGFVDSFGDHRIAMAAAVASAGCKASVTVSDPGCVAKSFPDFWKVYGSELDAEEVRR